MIVKCVRLKVEDFPFKSEVHRDNFRRWIWGKIAYHREVLDLEIGREYIVFAITEYQGYHFYFVDSGGPLPFDYHLQPGPCFQIVDSTVSKYWHYDRKIYVSPAGEETLHSTLAIKEWIEGFDFLNRLTDGQPHEKKVFLDAAVKIREEALQAKASNSNTNK